MCDYVKKQVDKALSEEREKSEKALAAEKEKSDKALSAEKKKSNKALAAANARLIAARKENIIAMIAWLREDKCEENTILERLMKRFSLTQAEAKDYMQCGGTVA